MRLRIPIALVEADENLTRVIHLNILPDYSQSHTRRHHEIVVQTYQDPWSVGRQLRGDYYNKFAGEAHWHRIGSNVGSHPAERRIQRAIIVNASVTEDVLEGIRSDVSGPAPDVVVVLSAVADGNPDGVVAAAQLRDQLNSLVRSGDPKPE